MKLEDLVVGEKYLLNTDNDLEVAVIVTAIGEENILLNKDEGAEYKYRKQSFLELYIPLPKKRETIELFPCLNTVGDLCYMDKNNCYPHFTQRKMVQTSTYQQRFKHLPSIHICKETFEIVEEA